jgi:hypothetical protein
VWAILISLAGQSEKDTNEDIIKVFNLFDQDKKVAALRVATC